MYQLLFPTLKDAREFQKWLKEQTNIRTEVYATPDEE